MMKSTIFTLFISLSSNAAFAGSIQIQSGSMIDLNPLVEKKILNELKEHCDGKIFCDFKIESKDDSFSPNLFSAQWTCSGETEVKTIELQEENLNQKHAFIDCNIESAFIFQNFVKNNKDRLELKQYFNLSFLNQKTTSLHDVAFPRQTTQLYRGVYTGHAHHKPLSILQSLLGIKTYSMNSKIYDYTSAKDESDKMSKLKSYYNSLSAEYLKNYYVNPSSGYYKNFADDAVFGDFFYEVAENYANIAGGTDGFILAFHDYFQRGIDLNYAMNQLGEKGSNRDAGEYLMPMLISPIEMEGLIFPNHNVALFKKVINGKPYLAYYENFKCIRQENNIVYECKKRTFNQFSSDYHPTHTEITETTQVAEATGLIGVCDTTLPFDSCKAPSETELKKHNIRLRSSRLSIPLSLSNLSTDQFKVKVFTD